MISAPKKNVLIVALICAFNALLVELGIGDFLSVFHDKHDLILQLALAFYLLGLGVGFLAPVESTPHLLKAQFIRVQWVYALGLYFYIPFVLLGMIFYCLYLSDHQAPHPAIGLRPLDLIVFVFLLFGIVFGYLSSLELKILSHFFPKLKNQKTYGTALGLIYLGQLMGGLAYAGLKNLQLSSQSILLLSSLFPLLNIILWSKDRHQIQLVACVGAGLFALSPLLAKLEQLQLKNFYYNTMNVMVSGPDKGLEKRVSGFRELLKQAEQWPPVKRSFGPLQVIDVTGEVRFGSVDPNHWRLYLNQHFQFASLNQADYHRFFARLALASQFHKKQLKVLIIGGGDGLLASSLLQDSARQIDGITIVELDQQMIHLALRPPLQKLNQGVFEHPKVSWQVADGLWWMRQSDESYNLILADIPYPYQMDVMRFFSREFFCAVGARLRPQGAFAMDIPLPRSDMRHSSLLFDVLKTLRSCNQKTAYFFQKNGESFMLWGDERWGKPLFEQSHKLGGVFWQHRPSDRYPINSTPIVYSMLRFLPYKDRDLRF